VAQLAGGLAHGDDLGVAVGSASASRRLCPRPMTRPVGSCTITHPMGTSPASIAASASASAGASKQFHSDRSIGGQFRRLRRRDDFGDFGDLFAEVSDDPSLRVMLEEGQPWQAPWKRIWTTPSG
jgi:hypothetical protein